LRVLKDTDASYIAAFVDGEGSISINMTNAVPGKRRSTSYGPRVSIANTNKVVLSWIHRSTGIGLVVPKPQSNGRFKDQWQWYLRVDEIEAFLLQIRGFLKIKREQADLMLEFLALEKNKGGIAASDEVRIDRMVIRDELCALNKRGR
jgi:hypothetical protein